MAQRPNINKTLNYGVNLAENQIERLRKFIDQVDNLLATNRQLTPEEVLEYKVARRIANKQATHFANAAMTTVLPPKPRAQRAARASIKDAIAALDAASMQLPEIGTNVQEN